MTEGRIKTETFDRFETELVYGRRAVDTKAARRRTLERLDLLWNHRRFLLKVFLAGLALSLTLALVLPHEYKSTVQLMPPDQQSPGLAAIATLAGRSSGSEALAGLAGLAGNLLGEKTTGDLFVGVLRSSTVGNAIITKFDLRKVYKTKLWEGAGKRLASNTQITADKKSGIITIVVTDQSPQRAAKIDQEYVTQLDWVITQLNTSSAHRERVFLEGRLQQVKQDLENAERDFSTFASKNVALDIPEQGKAMVEAASTLEGQLIAAQTELEGLKQIYSPNNVRVRSLEARIEELQRQIQKVGGNAASPDDPDGAGSVSLYPSIRKLPLLGVQYADLLRNTKVQEAIFEAFTQEYELAKVSEAKEVPSVKVLDPANIAERKSGPPRRMITLVGTLLVFGGGVFWILVSEHWRRIDPLDPTKSFVTRVYTDLRHDLPWLSRNGTASATSHTPLASADPGDPDARP
jgi:uncharacterized protein involved in exopolysaccharide biosynthesis